MVMAFITGMFTAVITVCLLPAAAIFDATYPVKYHTNGLMNVFPEHKIIPG